MRIESNVCYSNLSEKCVLDIYYPDKENGEVFIDFHGGGFVEGDKTDTAELCKGIAKAGYIVVSPNYSLYQNVKFPFYLKEAARAVKYIIDRFNVKPYVSGHSAGAYIAMMLAYNNELLKEVGLSQADIKGWIFESGQATSHFNIMHQEKGLDPYLQRIDEFAPLYYLNPNTRISRSLFILYTNDMPNRLEQNKLLISATKHYNPDSDITFLLLEGGHCQGCWFDQKINDYPFVMETIKWLKNEYNV